MANVQYNNISCRIYADKDSQSSEGKNDEIMTSHNIFTTPSSITPRNNDSLSNEWSTSKNGIIANSQITTFATPKDIALSLGQSQKYSENECAIKQQNSRNITIPKFDANSAFSSVLEKPLRMRKKRSISTLLLNLYLDTGEIQYRSRRPLESPEFCCIIWRVQPNCRSGACFTITTVVFLRLSGGNILVSSRVTWSCLSMGNCCAGKERVGSG